MSGYTSRHRVIHCLFILSFYLATSKGMSFVLDVGDSTFINTFMNIANSKAPYPQTMMSHYVSVPKFVGKKLTNILFPQYSAFNSLNHELQLTVIVVHLYIIRHDDTLCPHSVFTALYALTFSEYRAGYIGKYNGEWHVLWCDAITHNISECKAYASLNHILFELHHHCSDIEHEMQRLMALHLASNSMSNSTWSEPRMIGW